MTENNLKKNCIYCGKEFTVHKPCQLKNRKYCSHECAYKCPIRKKILSEKGKLVSHKGQTISEEQRKKISESMKRYYKQKGCLKEDKNVVVCDRWNSKTGKHVLNITYGELDKYREKHLVCEICGREEVSRAKNQYVENGKIIALTIDHDHFTNKFRGLLCRRCNRALGWFEKYQEGLSSYLNKGETTLG